MLLTRSSPCIRFADHDAHRLTACARTGARAQSNKSDAAGDNANFVCASIRDGSPQDQIDTTVTAMAGVELGLAGSDQTPEEAAKVYKDAAQKTYCK